MNSVTSIHVPIQFEDEKRILKFGPVFKEKREKEKAWSEFEFCLPTDEEKWRFKDVFYGKTTKVKCEFCYGTIFWYLEKGSAQR